jgi:hypothetical protein
MLSPRYRLIRLAGRIRLVIEMFPYSTVVLADNENFRLTVCVTATSPLIEAHDAVRREGGTCEPARAGGAGPRRRPRTIGPVPRPYDGGGHQTNRHGNRHPSDDEVES